MERIKMDKISRPMPPVPSDYPAPVNSPGAKEAIDIRLAEFRELISIRRNVRQIVNSLELCCSCHRICECEQHFSNKVVSVWLCRECLDRVFWQLEEQTGMHLRMDQDLQEQSPSGRSQSGIPNKITSQTPRGQFWIRECPRCKAPIEKQRPSDGWKCPGCGWK